MLFLSQAGTYKSKLPHKKSGIYILKTEGGAKQE